MSPPGIKELKVYCTIKFGTICGQWLANVINPFPAMFPFYTPWKHQEVQNENIGQNCVSVINLFVHNAPFLYLLKTENRKIFWCFQGLEKGCIGNGLMSTIESHFQPIVFLETLMVHALWVEQCQNIHFFNLSNLKMQLKFFCCFFIRTIMLLKQRIPECINVWQDHSLIIW